MEITSAFEILGFEPSIEEQLLLPKVFNNNLLVVYSAFEPLVRIHSLFIHFYLNRLHNEKQSSKVLILSKRSFQQKIHSSLKAILNRLMAVLNGSILPNARKIDYNNYSIILATPKIIKNDLKDGLFSCDHFDLVILNQAEMGASSKSLRYIANELKKSRFCGFTRISNKDRLNLICNNLQLKEIVQLKGLPSPQERSNFQYYSVPLPQEYFFVLELLEQIKQHELEILQRLGFSVSPKSSIREIAAIHESLAKEGDSKLQIQTGNLQRIITLQKIVISQGFPAIINYFETLQSKINKDLKFPGRKAITEFLKDLKIQKLREFINSHKQLKHPKSQILLKILSKYETGISIVTHNFYNSSFLKEYLTKHKYSVIYVKEPISSLQELKLAKAILPFTEGKSPVCITNSINEFIAQKAKIIIAYDVNADIIERLNNLELNIPKVFLIAKQTNEEARFFYLKKLGTNHLKGKNVDSSVLNVSSINPGGNDNVLDETVLPSNELSSSKGKTQIINQKSTLEFNKSLYEIGIPFLFSSKDNIITIREDIHFPGIILNQRVCLIILIPETIHFLIPINVSDFYKTLIKDYSQVHLVLYVQSLKDLNFNFQSELLHLANKYNIWISLLENDSDLPKLISRLNEKPLYHIV